MEGLKINLVFLTITVDGSFSGVNRYLEMMKNSLRGNSRIVVHRVYLFEKQNMLFPRVNVEDGCVEALVPFPLNARPIVKEDYWMTYYSQVVATLLEPYFRGKRNLIWNLHCIDVSRLAAILRQRLGGCILSYLHCIPWKFEIESNPRQFNMRYRKFLNKEYDNFNDKPVEKLTYRVADHIVCVTQSARDYLEKFMQVPADKISVVMNGIEPDGEHEISYERKKTDILYVGRISKEKGVPDLLKALRLVKRTGYDFRLILAGKGNPVMVENLKSKYAELDLNFLGQISFSELKQLYQTCVLGVIPSLHEQCSYVALEMTMYGVPLIVSDVDGLSEMFEDRETALKIPLRFQDELGLSVEVSKLAEAVIYLLENPNLRRQLGKNARCYFKGHFTSEIMLKNTLEVYDKVINKCSYDKI